MNHLFNMKRESIVFIGGASLLSEEYLEVSSAVKNCIVRLVVNMD